MKIKKFLQNSAFLFLFLTALFSCVREVDPGTLQNDERDYSLLDFDRIDMGDAFVITVQQSPVYSIHVRGDKRNLDDIAVVKNGSTLNIHYSDNRAHDHTTYVTITMPVLAGASLSGASNAMISGFKDVKTLEMIMSGAAEAQLNLESKLSTVNLSGASRLTISGKTDLITIKASGASELFGYGMSATSADVDASGASKVNIYALQSLKAVASGAGIIHYRGDASVNANVSGAGEVRKD